MVEPHRYGESFFSYTTVQGLAAARAVVPLVQEALPVRSIADFGCGEGAWLRVWKELGAADVLGVDGPYVDPERLLVEQHEFAVRNLEQPVALGRSFDLAESIEVAEHLEAAAARNFVSSLCAHAPRVLFSAAVPGQGGEHHVNEQPHEYWRALFAERGFEPFDYLRPRLQASRELAPWHRFNLLLYIQRDHQSHLPPAVLASAVPPDREIADFAPPLYRVRKWLVRRLPRPVQDRLAAAKSRLQRNPG
ncbi:MAG TPA: methyltransferase domain-containing protein [Thermoanaerobaculia bacterium]|nr:methyltransferase domain-containing protein [Thermoanaerobaculia bacterium]